MMPPLGLGIDLQLVLLRVVPEFTSTPSALSRFDERVTREAEFLEVHEQHVAVVIDALLVSAAIRLGNAVQLGQTIIHQANVLVHELIQGVQPLELLAGQAAPIGCIRYFAPNPVPS